MRDMNSSVRIVQEFRSLLVGEFLLHERGVMHRRCGSAETGPSQATEMSRGQSSIIRAKVNILMHLPKSMKQELV